MIATSTPLRVTLGGGGTDLPSFYRRHGGFIFAMGVDKYMYLMVNTPLLDEKVRLHYSRSETVEHIDELKHDLARAALRLHGFERRIEISSVADLPDGTGLGSSSAYLVGLLTALRALRGTPAPRQAVAEEACQIELELLGKPIGKQDQYMAAFGGLTALEIEPDGSVQPRAVSISASALEALIANTHLYYTGVRRSAVEVLQEQNGALQGNGHGGVVEESLQEIRSIGRRILRAIESEDLDAWGCLLHEHWEHKRRLSRKVIVQGADELYEHVRREFGVLGGKIAGAGGGGFLMLYAPREHERLERFMAARGMPRLHYGLAPEGARVVGRAGGSAAAREPRVDGRPAERAVVR